MNRRCEHPRTRCVHGDEVWARMKVYLLRWWKGGVIYRQACLDCDASLDRVAVCTRWPGRHEFAGQWREGGQADD